MFYNKYIAKNKKAHSHIDSSHEKMGLRRYYGTKPQTPSCSEAEEQGLYRRCAQA